MIIRSSKLDSGHVTVVLIVGGGQAAIANLAPLHPDAVLAFDVQDEVEKIQLKRSKKPSWKVALAHGKTTRHLARNATRDFQQMVKDLPSVAADCGLAQEPGFGRLAAAEFIESHSFKRIMTDLISALRTIANGTLTGVTLRVMSSLAGGTGSGAATELADAMAAFIHRAGNVVVQIRFEHLGGLTFEPVSPRTQVNTAAGTLLHLSFLTDDTRHDGDVPSLMLTELTPRLRKNRPLRNARVALLYQASSCNALDEVIKERIPNWTSEGRYGNVWLRRADFYNCISREEVAFDIAPTFHESISRLICDVRPDYARVHISVTPMMRAVSRPRLDTLQSLFLKTDMDVPGLLAAVCQPGSQIRTHVHAEYKDGSRVALAAICTLWGKPPACTKEAKLRLVTYRTGLEYLEKQRDKLRQDLVALKAELKKMSTQFRRIAKQIKPTRVFDAAVAIMTSRARKMRWFMASAKKLRETADAVRLCVSKLVAVSHAIRALRIKDRLERRHYSGILQRLSRFVPKVSQGHKQPLVVARPLDAVWSSIWELPTLTRDESLEVLLEAVSVVTLHGLARVTHAEEPVVTSIAASLLFNNPPEPGPWWGGRIRLDEGDTFFVLPPICVEDLSAIRNEFRRLCPNSCPEVLAADSAAAGATVVKFTLHRVRALDELFTEHLQHALVSAYQDASLYGLNEEMLGKHGLEVNGRVLFFPNNRPATDIESAPDN